MTLTINNRDYILSLKIKDCVRIEEYLKENPIKIITDCVVGERTITLTEASRIFQGILHTDEQLTYEAVLDLLDAYLQQHSFADLLVLFVEVLMESGYIKKTDKDDKTSDEKN